MKKLFILLLLIIFPISLKSQEIKFTGRYGYTVEDSLYCLKNQSIYSTHYEQKNYELSVQFWRHNYNYFPISSENLYIRGVVMFEYFYNSTKDKAYLDTLFMIIDKRIEYFGKETELKIRKAYYYMQYSQDNLEYIKNAYNLFKECIDNNSGEVNDNTISNFMNISTHLYSLNEITSDDLINNYSNLVDILDSRNESINHKNRIDDLFRNSRLSTCDNIILIFKDKLNNRFDDVELHKRVMDMLSKSNCVTSDFYYNLVEKLYTLEKSPTLANHLAEMNIIKNNFNLAEKYYLEAIDLEIDDIIKSNHLVKLATLELTYKNYIKSRDFARKSIELNPNNAMAYFIIGSVYANSKISDDDFINKTVYWVVVDYFIKAKNIDESLKDRCDEAINAYSFNFPTSEDAFFNGMYETEGSTYLVKGWINEKTTVRFRK